MKKIFFICTALIIYQSHLPAQTQAFYFVNYPQSVSAFSSGWQGVAVLSNDDALTYNPAKLALTKSTKISYFRNPFYMVGFGPFPLINISVYQNVKDIGSFGVSYENRSYGEVLITNMEFPDGTGEKFNMYDRSISAGYSRKIADNFWGGIQLRYAYMNLYDYKPESFSVSLGLLYNPEFCEKRFSFGFSLMNLGPAIKYEFGNLNGINSVVYDPPPTNLNLGLNVITTESDYFSIPFMLGISKPFDERDNQMHGQSSFKTLFTDWSDFPNDVSLHTGLGFVWKPLRLGDNFNFIQEFFVGNYSQGNKSNLMNFYNHGFNIGFEFYDYKFTAGFAGVSHNVHNNNFIRWEFPYEVFQFTLEVNDNIFYKDKIRSKTPPLLEKIILSFGLGYTSRVGRAAGSEISSFKITYGNNYSYNLEASFYFDRNNALVTSIIYNSVPYNIKLGSWDLINTKFETFSFFSSYRYHPLNFINNTFIQGGLGIYRWNPVIKSSPRYDYETALQFMTGLNIINLEPIVFTPFVEYTLLFYTGEGSAPRIQGFNIFNLGLKAGVRI